MKVHATLNNLRVAPRKVRLVTHSIVGVDASEALIQLSKQTKKSSQPIHDLLKSAVANATNNFGLDKDNLYVFAVRVGDGLRLQRWLPRAFGRATPLLRRGSNVTLILEEKVEGKNRTEKKKQEAIVTVKESEVEEVKEEKSEARPIKTEGTGSRVSGKTGGKFVKKVFQRKAA